ncbi:hypothetical protein [Oceanicola sp. 502str15]|uniref:hypothetical protein n=1 Tax=Oceanicola sp. 502str15 TaxID=2696061 RepID=UPI00209493C6|nr:hypothetical protein [Oceanicola sp. 502str15]MCO6381705.1 hypothetical protein [Oceanicola sp. 502str15]
MLGLLGAVVSIGVVVPPEEEDDAFDDHADDLDTPPEGGPEGFASASFAHPESL